MDVKLFMKHQCSVELTKTNIISSKVNNKAMNYNTNAYNVKKILNTNNLDTSYSRKREDVSPKVQISSTSSTNKRSII